MISTKFRIDSRQIIVGAVMFFLIFLSQKALAQLPSCDGTVPFYSVNLTGQPAGSWLSPQHKRNGSCCGQPANCTSFEVTLDSNAAALSFQFYSGAVPSGSLSYQINCGPSVPVGQPICISGVGPHRITFCKPGSNTNEYLITSIAKPTFPQDDSTRNGCSKKFEVLGLDTSTVTWQSVYPGAPGNYNNLLSCTSNCTETYFTPQITSPPYIDYRVCGFPQADECGYVLTLCDTFRVYTVGALTGSITPNPAGYCQLGPGSGVTLTAQGVGGNNAYNYTWYNNLNNVVGTGPTFFATTQQTYTVEIKDGLTSPTCASYTASVPVVQTSQPTVNAGNDQLLCPDISEVQLSGSVNFATGGKWTGGAGGYTPSDTSLVCSYTPTPAEIASGTLSLYLTSTGAGGSCTNVTDTVVINFPDFLNINLKDTLLKCNQSSVVLNPNVTGGVTPYNYIWSNGTSGSTATVGEGTYCLTVVDDLGCSHDTCVTVSVPAALNLSMSSTAATTNGGTNGSATASPSGGTLPYSYLWNPVGNTATINGLGYGIYSVTVIDGNGCNIQGSVVVSEPRCLGFGVSTVADTLLCYGDASATATALPVGGTSPYVYLWDDPSSSTTQSVTSLTGGLYSVVVSDSNNCLAVATAIIEEPTKLVNSIFSNNATVVGGTDGSATANTFGGETPYTYSWSTIPTQNGANATGLSAGVYYVTITDKNNCSILDSVLINEPPCNNYLLYVSGTNLSCEGSNNGTANVVIIGGTSPYNILWSNTQTTAAISGLSANTYTVEVTDAANCYSFKNITITEPNELQASANLIQDMSCFGTNNGTVDLVVVGGTYPYTYVWSNGSTSEDLINLSQGNYSVLVTDKNGCTANDVVTITQPALLTSNYTKQNVKCFGDSTGSIDVTPIGGTSPYTYLWSNGATTQDVSNLTAGLYNYTVYDANSCNSPLAASILITEPDLVVLDSFYVPCPVVGSGVSVVEFYPIGGTPSYQLSSDSGLTYASFGQYNISTSVGVTYQIMVRDTNGCLSMGMDSMVINPSVVIDSVIFEKCFTTSQNMSDVGVYVSGGDGGLYQVSYDSGAFNAAGDYTDSLSINGAHIIVAQDGLGCLALPYTINVPDRLIASSAITSDYNGNDVSCKGSTDGTALASATGGQTPYSYLWSDMQSTAAATGLGAGTYQVTITDVNGCVEQSQVTLNEPTQVELANFSIDCPVAGATTAVVNFTPAGGTPSYQISTDNGLNYLPFSQNSTSLTIGSTYHIMVRDTNGCLSLGMDSIVINQSVVIDSVIFEKCFTTSQNMSDVEVFISGGDGGLYQVSYDSGIFNVAGDYTDSLSINGVHTIEAQDGLGCLSLPYTINVPDRLLVSSVITSDYNGNDVSCNGSTDGTALATATGGEQPYSYLWSNAQTDSLATSLGAGMYQVTITDVNGCSKVSSVTLTEPTLVELDSFFVSCPVAGGLTTVVDFYPIGGTLSYQISTNNGMSYLPFNQNSTTLAIGTTYQIMVRDTNGCLSMGMDSIVINPSVVIDSVNFEKCFVLGQNMSDVEVFISGGDGGMYQVSYDSGLFNVAGDYTDSLSINGVHTIVAQDGLGCLSLPYTINVPDRLLLSSSITSDYYGNDVSCNGSTDGTALATATGGEQPYGYLWSNAQTDSIATGLGAGMYQVTITDVNGCSEVSSVILTEPDSLTLTISVSSNYNGSDVSCYGSTDGAIDLTVVGGTLPYSYLWNNTAQTEDISSLGAGYYDVVVTDTNNCTSMAVISVNQPDTILLSAVISHVKCNSYTDGAIDLTVTGGVAPYQYNWSNSEISQDISNIGVGSYSVTVTDTNNCLVTTTYMVNEEDPIAITSLPEHVTCYNLSDGIISTGVTGGVQPYSYLWSTGETTASLDSLVTGTYILTVTDSNNCFKNDTILITQPDSLFATINSELYPNGHHITLFQMQDGSVDLTVFGGTTPYQFEWSNGTNTEDLNNVGAGEYSVVITDENGCKYNTNITLTEPFDLEMPTVITPNGDGNNDYFLVHGLESYPVNTIVIFNRWGDEVYSMNNYDNKWQGKSNDGNNLPAGNYFIILKINNGAIVLTGYCEVLR